MQTKTYFASSVPSALDVARRELGPDAMLVRSRPSPEEVRAFGRLEVTFAFEEKAESAPSSAEPLAPRNLPTELDDLRRQIVALRDAVGNVGGVVPAQSAAAPAGFADYLQRAGSEIERRVDVASPFVARLCANGLSEELASELVLAAAGKSAGTESSIVDALTERIPIRAFGEMKAGETRTLAFIGPAGRGKTTSLVKVAVRYGLARRVPVRIYSAGAHAIGGQEQLARFASILGVPFQAFESLDSLHLALNGEAWKGLVLIDTPGLSRADSVEIGEFATFFSRRPDIEKHLVLRAEARTADLLYSVAGFSALAPSRLLFSGMDEALTLGSTVEVLTRTGIPATFTGTGQAIPDELEDADAAKLARMVCGRSVRATLAAA